MFFSIFPLFFHHFAVTLHPITRIIITFKIKQEMINSQEIKIGTCIRMDGKVWVCIDFQHRKPGKGNTVMNTKLKNVADGRVLERTFQVGFKLEDVRVERRPYQYLYEDATGCIFMNQETFEQVPIAKENVTGGQYMKEGDVVEVVTDTTDGTILLAEMPAKTTLKITHSRARPFRLILVTVATSVV